MPLTVACVLKSGGVYNSEWVSRLKACVSHHLPIAHRFVCLSDVPVPCERIPLAHNWEGWWSKVELFKLQGPVLYLDLDTLVVGDLSDIAATAQRSPLVALRDFYRPDGIGSGVLAWSGEDKTLALLYDRFSRDAATWQSRLGRRGDQGYIEEAAFLAGIVRWQDALPGQIVSYKVHCRGGVIPAHARVVCLHGYPKFSDMPATDAVRKAWEHAA